MAWLSALCLLMQVGGIARLITDPHDPWPILFTWGILASTEPMTLGQGLPDRARRHLYLG